MNELEKGEGRLLVSVLVLAASALAVGLWHGLPHLYIPDTHIIRNALGMAQTKNLWPAAGTFSTYPYLLAYLLLPIYAFTFIAGKLFGVYASAEEFGAQVVEDPTLIYMEARIMVALFGLAAVFYLYKTARLFGFSPITAAGAALLLAFNPLFVHFGHHARPWIPIACGVVFTFYYSGRMVLSGRRRDYLLAGIGAGLTFAAHQVGGAVLLIPMVAFLMNKDHSFISWKKLSGLAGLLCLFVLTALVLGYGHQVWGGAGQEVIQTEEAALDIGGQKMLWTAFAGERAYEISLALFGYDPLGTVLGVVGLVAALSLAGVFKGLRLAMALYCVFTATIFLLYKGSHIRYMIPLLPFFALGTSWAAGKMGKRAFKREAVLLWPLVLFSAVQTGRMDLLFMREDTRDQARAWIEAQVPHGKRIALEGYSPALNPTPDSLRFLRDQAGIPLSRKERMILEGKLKRAPSYHLIPLERFYDFQSYWPHQYRLEGDKPIQEFLDERGTQWILLSDRWPHLERHAPLMDYMAEKVEIRATFSPAGEPSILPGEATFPLGMEFALIALWELERPGPLIRLYEKKE